MRGAKKELLRGYTKLYRRDHADQKPGRAECVLAQTACTLCVVWGRLFDLFYYIIFTLYFLFLNFSSLSYFISLFVLLISFLTHSLYFYYLYYKWFSSKPCVVAQLLGQLVCMTSDCYRAPTQDRAWPEIRTFCIHFVYNLNVCDATRVSVDDAHYDACSSQFFHGKRGIKQIMRLIHNMIIYLNLKNKSFNRFGSGVGLAWTSLLQWSKFSLFKVKT